MFGENLYKFDGQRMLETVIAAGVSVAQVARAGSLVIRAGMLYTLWLQLCASGKERERNIKHGNALVINK
jgi:hypothetical protein